MQFNYLFMNNATKDPYELFEQINDCAKFSNLLDYNQMNLLHYAAKIGFSRSVNFFLRFLDPNQIDSNNYSPLSLAILNGHHGLYFAFCFVFFKKFNTSLSLQNAQ